jgi:hypothetical protein
MRKLFASLCASSLLALGLVSTAGAQQQADGLVVVQIDDVTVTDVVDVNVAAGVVAQLCDVDVGPLSLGILGQAVAVDRSGRERTICTTDQGPISIQNN